MVPSVFLPNPVVHVANGARVTNWQDIRADNYYRLASKLISQIFPNCSVNQDVDIGAQIDGIVNSGSEENFNNYMVMGNRNVL